jgi:hypothetical protein
LPRTWLETGWHKALTGRADRQRGHIHELVSIGQRNLGFLLRAGTAGPNRKSIFQRY